MYGSGLAEAEEGGDGEDGCEFHVELLVRLDIDSVKLDEILVVLLALVLNGYV